MAVILDGKLVSQRARERLRREVEELRARGVVPGLAVVLVGEDVGSQVYVRNKSRACDELGIRAFQYSLPADTTQEELLELLGRLNADPEVHGILVQSPLPEQIDEAYITNCVAPEKDVDAFHPFNVGRIMLGDYAFLPCTPAGIMEILAHYGIDPAGKHCVVVGRSHIVGRPMSMLLLHANATVTVCHSHTRELAGHTRRADILVAAVGKERFITADMVKPGAVVIDVGMNRDSEGRLCGDVDFAGVEPLASHITPVPGGVGPMTITELMQNTVTAARLAARRQNAE
ncbi:MAG: bifunctional methylenetetrahydrofolate dehydrogenase/methenyltetrahydrofolate cyclohydrolase FolD [Clostridiales bacterium]|nr:bifunctional methylenetetrahydrofolate dehydrogenase/methenyltetrahydrofolate cyclohydrolase FolD [Clostridiales bacterium]